jgi:hypothetical protein
VIISGVLILVMTEQQIGTPMNRATRVLLMSGVAVAAGMAFSAPAMASTATPAHTTTVTQVAPRHTWSEGHFRSLGACLSEGRRGVWRGDWDHYRCVRTGRGFELIVSEDWNHWNNGNWGWNHRNDHRWGNKGGKDWGNKGGKDWGNKGDKDGKDWGNKGGKDWGNKN